MEVFRVPILLKDWQNQFLPLEARGEDVQCNAVVDLDAVQLALPGGALRQRAARNCLLHLQRADGAWGGFKDDPPSIEETALALEALAGSGNGEEEDHAAVKSAQSRGLDWLLTQVESGAWMEPSPIGFYFAKLWYYERLYPLIFTVGALERVAAD